MIIIKTFEDTELIPDDPDREAVQRFFREVMAVLYEEAPSEEIGWCVYFEEGDDMFGVNPEAGFHFGEHKGIYFTLFEDPDSTPGWEAVDYSDDMYVVTMVMNNDYAMTYFVPDREWLDPGLRERLEEYKTLDDNGPVGYGGERRNSNERSID